MAGRLVGMAGGGMGKGRPTGAAVAGSAQQRTKIVQGPCMVRRRGQHRQISGPRRIEFAGGIQRGGPFEPCRRVLRHSVPRSRAAIKRRTN